jgi:hypothetical protein
VWVGLDDKLIQERIGLLCPIVLDKTARFVLGSANQRFF